MGILITPLQALLLAVTIMYDNYSYIKKYHFRYKSNQIHVYDYYIICTFKVRSAVHNNINSCYGYFDTIKCMKNKSVKMNCEYNFNV